MNRICQVLLRPSFASNLTATARTTMPMLVTAPRCWYSADAAAPPAALDKPTLDKLVRTNKVVVFMKGNPQAPRCGFSNAVVQIMRMHGVQYDAHDVLQNEALRQGKLVKVSRATVESNHTLLQASRITRIGQPYHRFLSTANLSAAVIFCCRCTKAAI